MPAAFMKAARAHRNRLEKIATVPAAAKLKRTYDEAQAAVLARIKREVKSGWKDSFTAHQQRIVLGQIRQGQAVVAQRLAGDLRPLSEKAQQTALRGLIADVTALHKQFTGSEIVLPIEEAATFEGVIAGRAPSLLSLHRQSMARYGAQIVGDVQHRLALSLVQGDTMMDAYDALAELIDDDWWKGERIARSEMSYAFNLTHRDGIVETAKEVPELRQRWEEHCDDSGAPLDDRVRVDSIAMHGQVTDAGGVFTMPATAPFPDARGETNVPRRLVGLKWAAPPNRPQDRAVVSPWMAEWGVPGWEYVAGRRVSI